MSPSNVNCLSNGGGCNGRNHIKHQVSKMDTLAGVAIKYGVEVADIKRLNGLATDLQMFALKTLLIPLPGRHPPSPVLSSTSDSPGTNGLDKTPARPRYSNLLESFESLGMKSTEEKISPAMSTLQKFYGLNSSKPKATESPIYRTPSSGYLNEELLPKNSQIPKSPHCNLKSRNSANSLLSVDSITVDYIPLAEAMDPESEKFVRRRQKCEVDFRDGISVVRKSSSTPSLNEQENGNSNSNSSSLWGTSKWSLKSDLQAFSSGGISIPIFDGLPKPISGRKSKAALD